ncbi:10188_t:CDS:2 [Diversispora eburnea]|uniref:10188_t:CDS:1 n=1 Tax=Diversispora eburnea TaxID=1213867 RepID=A0A9N8ZNP3_9GLOM|nr:10188_t:CDS:2 [Diversispora eburnea]
MSCTTFAICLNYFINDFDSPIFGSYGKLGWLHWTNEQQWIVLYAQNLTLFAFVWYLVPILIFIPIQELVKMHDMKHYTKFQKRSKLLFNTKLGMHSPV